MIRTTDRLRAQIEELRVALEREWEENHFEHCSREWPHPPGRPCNWPRPAVLDPLADENRSTDDLLKQHLVSALRQAAAGFAAIEVWARKEDEGTGIGQPHLIRNDAERARTRILAVLAEYARDAAQEPDA